MKCVVIVGVGRSGTSLLQSMFASHPIVACLPETSFLRRYCISRVLSRKLTTDGRDGVIKILAEDLRWKRTGLCAETLVEKSLSCGAALELELYRNMIKEYSELHAVSGVNSQWVIDKDPRLIEFLPLVKLAWNDAYIVHIIRDPRDVLLSKQRAQWSRDRYTAHHLFANRVQMRLGRQFGTQLFGDRYKEIRYEDLITSPYDHLGHLCRAIGLEFHESMMNFQRAASELVSVEELSWKKETLGPLLSGNQAKWRENLPERHIALTELCNDEAFDVGRYDRADRGKAMSLGDRAWIAFWAAVIRLTTPLYTAYRKRALRKACRQLK